jgi:hypothetical protein
MSSYEKVIQLNLCREEQLKQEKEREEIRRLEIGKIKNII